jgi:septin family protein
LKAQASVVSDDEVITQTIKVLRARLLHSHLVREKLKTVAELYENFTSATLSSKHDEASRPVHYSDNRQHSYPM